MKRICYIVLTAVAAMSVSCKEIDPLVGAELGEMGITSVSAAFTGELYESDPNAKFSAQPDENGNIVIEVPYFYPESSDNEVPEELLENMRVSASLATGTRITPGLGILDLTQEYHVTASDAAGRTIDYVISAEITKLSGCSIESFNVTSGGTVYSGIINNETIALMVTEDELPGCTIDYRISNHAVLSGYTEGMAIKDGDKFTVTAHNGVDKKEYTVSFDIPEKIAYGARIGSGKKLWSKLYSTDYSESVGASAPLRMAAHRDLLYVLNGTGTIYSIDRKTGEYKGTLSLPDGYSANSIVNDEAGNILFSSDAVEGAEFKIYYLEAIDGTPVELVSYTNGISGSTGLGNIRVAGNIRENAVVTANSAGTTGGGMVWQITGGVAGEGKYTENTACTSLGNIYNGCIVPASDNISDGVFSFGYWGVYDLYHSSDLSSYSVVIDTDNAGNENTNCISTATFNGARYLAYGIGAHFSYGYCPQFSIVDSTTPSAMSSAELYAVPYSELNTGGFKGTGATSDILIVVSEDGYYMDVYFTDGNYDVIACYEFDCIQQ